MYFNIFLGLIVFTLLSCSSHKLIDGIYQQYTYRDGPYSVQTLFLNVDSSYEYYYYGNEIDYATFDGSVGEWTIQMDTIFFYPVRDSFTLQVKYIHNTDTNFHIQLSDQSGYPFKYPTLLYGINKLTKKIYDVDTIISGEASIHLNEKVDQMWIWAFDKDQKIRQLNLNVNADSMFIQVFGLGLINNQEFEKTFFIKKSNTLYGHHIDHKNDDNSTPAYIKMKRKNSLKYINSLIQE